MRLGSVVIALLPILSLIAKANASANATASPTFPETFSSTGDRSGTLISKPPFARDEERVNGIKKIGWGNKYVTFLAKAKQAVWRQDATSRLELKVAWWRVKNVHPDTVYTRLKLDKVDENILSNHWFHVWFKYVKSYNSKHPKKTVSAIGMLREKYDDYDLTMVLEQAKEEGKPVVRAIGATLQREQMDIWKSKGITPDLLYDFLQPNRMRPHVLTGRAYNIWDIYFAKLNPGNSMSPFEKLYHTYGDAGLPSLLIVANQPKKNVALAQELHDQLEQLWLDQRVTPKHLFERLMLAKNPNYLLDKWEIQVWMRYAKLYRETIGTHVPLNEIIGTSFNKDEIKIILETARTKNGRELAKALSKKFAEKKAAARAEKNKAAARP